MTYIPPSFERPIEWVDVCASCLQISKDEAASMYARLCGFGSWDIMAEAVGVIKPTKSDEECTKSELSSRIKNYLAILVDEFDINYGHAVHLVEKISPSSRKKPQRFSFDSENYKNGDHAGIDLNPMGVDRDEMISSFIDMLPEELKSQLEGISTSDFENSIRMAMPVDPGVYYDYLVNMGFSLIDGSFNENHEIGCPSFSFSSSRLSKKGEIPVFILNISVNPLDDKDYLSIELLNHVTKELRRNRERYAVVLWKSPLVKKYKGGQIYCVGKSYLNGKWSDLILKDGCESIEELMELSANIEDINDPGSEYVWNHPRPLVIFHMIESGVSSSDEFFQKYSISTLRDASGWGTTLCGER
jgi:hypothetical protein